CASGSANALASFFVGAARAARAATPLLPWAATPLLPWAANDCCLRQGPRPASVPRQRPPPAPAHGLPWHASLPSSRRRPFLSECPWSVAFVGQNPDRACPKHDRIC